MKDNSLTDLVLNTISFMAQQQDVALAERLELIKVLLERIQ